MVSEKEYEEDAKTEVIHKRITLPSNSTFYTLRKRIGQEFSMDMDSLTVYIKSKMIHLSRDIEEQHDLNVIDKPSYKEKNVLRI